MGRDNGGVAQVVLFHSAFGLRQVERSLAGHLRAAGHRVLTPDLYAGQTSGTLDAALRLMDTIGWETICGRAEQALRGASEDAVLAGISMGAGVTGHLWQERPQAAGVVLLHGIAPIPASPRPGQPVQVHAAAGDPFAPGPALTQWQEAATTAGLAVSVFTYTGAGHFYTDPDLADYHPPSARLTWQRVTTFLSTL